MSDTLEKAKEELEYLKDQLYELELPCPKLTRYKRVLEDEIEESEELIEEIEGS